MAFLPCRPTTGWCETADEAWHRLPIPDGQHRNGIRDCCAPLGRSVASTVDTINDEDPA